MDRKLGIAAALSLVLASPFAPGTGSGASAAPVPGVVAPARTVHPVEKIKQDLVRQLVIAMSDDAVRTALTEALAEDGHADLTTLFAGRGSRAGDRFTRHAIRADRSVKLLKGLNRMRDSVLAIRLANPGTDRRAGILVAASSAAEDTVVAYDVRGGRHLLDARHRPRVPVAVVELDTDKIMPVAVKVLSDELAAAGVGSDLIKPRRTAAPGPRAAASKVVTVLDRILVNDDQEPWISGRAEFYGVALGQGTDGAARVDLVDMPYLDYDHTTYYPNQIIVDWSHYKWNAVDFMLMEHDDNSNYRDIAVAIANAIAPFTGYEEYVQLVTAVLNALPADWFTNDDDYADSLYFLTRSTQGERVGAANNGQVTLSQHVVTT